MNMSAGNVTSISEAATLVGCPETPEIARVHGGVAFRLGEGGLDPTPEKRFAGQVGEDSSEEFRFGYHCSYSEGEASICELSNTFPVKANSTLSAVDEEIDTHSVLPHLFNVSDARIEDAGIQPVLIRRLLHVCAAQRRETLISSATRRRYKKRFGHGTCKRLRSNSMSCIPSTRGS